MRGDRLVCAGPERRWTAYVETARTRRVDGGHSDRIKGTDRTLAK
jgi:hypothetical protein